MDPYFMEFEIPLLKALVKPDGSTRPVEAYPEEEGFNGIENVRIHETGKHHRWKQIPCDRCLVFNRRGRVVSERDALLIERIG